MACLTWSGASDGAAAVPSSSRTAFVPGTSGPVHFPALSILGGGGSVSKGVPPVAVSWAIAPVGTMTHTIAMKIGANARGKNDIDLSRRPAGLADGLALKEPALRDPHVAVRPN